RWWRSRSAPSSALERRSMTAEDLQMETSPAVIDRRYSTLGREVQHVSNKCEKGVIGFNRGALGRDNRASPGPVAELPNRRRSQDAHGIAGPQCPHATNTRWETGSVRSVGHRAQQALSARRLCGHVHRTRISKHWLGNK